MIVELLVMAFILFNGVFLQRSGVVLAVTALSTGIFVDALLLFIYLKFKPERKLHEVYIPGLN